MSNPCTSTAPMLSPTSFAKPPKPQPMSRSRRVERLRSGWTASNRPTRSCVVRERIRSLSVSHLSTSQVGIIVLPRFQSPRPHAFAIRPARSSMITPTLIATGTKARSSRAGRSRVGTTTLTSGVNPAMAHRFIPRFRHQSSQVAVKVAHGLVYGRRRWASTLPCRSWVSSTPCPWAPRWTSSVTWCRTSSTAAGRVEVRARSAGEATRFFASTTLIVRNDSISDEFIRLHSNKVAPASAIPVSRNCSAAPTSSSRSIRSSPIPSAPATHIRSGWTLPRLWRGSRPRTDRFLDRGRRNRWSYAGRRRGHLGHHAEQARELSRGGGRDDRAHHAVALTLRSLVAEPEPLVHGPGGVVEERSRGLLALGQVVRVRLDEAASFRGDQRQRTPHGDRGHSRTTVAAVDEQARDPVVRHLGDALFPLLAVVDVRQLWNRPELGPGDRDVTVENQGGVRTAGLDQTPLELAMAERPALLRGIRVEVEVRAPAPTPHAVVPFGEIRKRVPRLHGQGFDPVAVHRQGAHPQTVAPEGVALSRSAPSRTPLWSGRRREGRLACADMDDAAAAVPPDLTVLTGTEREVLEGFLELCRGAVARKLAGVAELDARRSLVPSRTTLLGLVKHLAAVEREWFGMVLGGRSPDQLGVPADDGWGPGPHDTVEGVLEDYRRPVRSRGRSPRGSTWRRRWCARSSDRCPCGGSTFT